MEIGFHEGSPNELLQKYFGQLGLTEGRRILVPLCGKTIDIHWLLDQGFRVVGVELNEKAVKELFQELKLAPKVENLKVMTRYSAENVDIFVGNIFDLAGTTLGPVDAIYDRAAMVALPQATRKEYAAHLKDITGKAPQLVITFQYDQSQMEGPPFSISSEELELHYGRSYDIEELESRPVDGKLKGEVEAVERICMLSSTDLP